MDGFEATGRVIGTLERLGYRYMLVGGLSSMAYGIPRSTKDADDLRDVIAVQGDEALDWDYIHRWTAEHGTRELLDEIRASIPPLD